MKSGMFESIICGFAIVAAIAGAASGWAQGGPGGYVPTPCGNSSTCQAGCQTDCHLVSKVCCCCKNATLTYECRCETADYCTNSFGNCMP